MTIAVYNENGRSIEAALASYDVNYQFIQQDIIPVGGGSYDRPAQAAHWVFSAPGYNDAARNDLLNYETFTEQLIPKYRWVAPVLLGLSAYWLFTRAIKF